MFDLTAERIVVTGGSGFLGRHVIAELLRHGAPRHNILTPTHSEFDLTDEDDVRALYAKLKPTVVIHLAARVGGIGGNRDNPGLYFYDNLVMGLHLIEHARLVGIKKFVQVGTICAYPKFTPVPFKEIDLWSGYPEETNAPYGIAKKALLVMLQSYRQQYGLNGIYLLPVNLYGPGDNFDPASSHVVPALIRKFVEARNTGAKEVCVWGTGNASREFLYVEDAARAVVLATERYEGHEPVNVGAGFEITIKQLVIKIANLIGFDGSIFWDISKPDGQPRRMLDTSRALGFGFEATTGFDDGLYRTLEWWMLNQNYG